MILFVLDTLKKEAFIVDSNSGTTYNKTISSEIPLDFYYYVLFQHYCNNSGYSFITLKERQKTFNFNRRQQKYGGYCVGWSLFFREIAINCDINDDFLDTTV